MAHEIEHACILCGAVRIVKAAHIRRGRKLICTVCNAKRTGSLLKHHKDILELYQRYQHCRECGSVFEQNFLTPTWYCTPECQSKKRNKSVRMALIACKLRPTQPQRG